MTDHDIYRDIATRAGGDIYIGVVGPVRTGKSTFIKRFMDILVFPNMVSPYEKTRIMDELPQSGEVQIDRTRTQLATSWKRKLCTAHPGKDRTQKDNGRAHFPHQVLWNIALFHAARVNQNIRAGAPRAAPQML